MINASLRKTLRKEGGDIKSFLNEYRSLIALFTCEHEQLIYSSQKESQISIINVKVGAIITGLC